MKAWLERIVQVALLRAGPQDLPGGSAPLIAALLMWWLLVAPMLLLAPEPLPFFDALLTFSIQLALIHLVLLVNRRPQRFAQSAQALFGTGALIGLLNLPLWLAPGPPIPAPLVLLALTGLCWSLAVDGHVWRHSLELPYAGGLAVAVLVFLLQIVTLQAIGLGA
ncbi:hypothetical protein HFP89_15060 [Wenzhouxiangella sp. XN79A]|uniref:hypothetical protein n=1 Tax=Wenzhouxiangella sp. XN79A TaxID=2724193 RepID=UPI00144AAF0E|nr:hypothetical protein [Wenzhouxiangella sp. XN79A]NKI36488.1 hypothetical protein [Wenzhouxiangella sp. XN79A]